MTTKPSSTWYRLSTSSIPGQGDILFDFPLLIARHDEQEASMTVDQESLDLIVLTQSCDLENGKVTRILVAPAVSLSDWLLENPFDLNRLEEIRRGFDTSLYLLPSWPSGPKELEKDRVVDFGHLQTIDAAQVNQFVEKLGERVTLISPALEHFSQAVARSFMRVGLPIDVPSFKLESDKREKQEQELSSLPFETSDYYLAQPLKVIRHVLHRRQTNETFYRLTSAVQGQPTIEGAGYTEETAYRSLARQLVRRYLAAQEGETHWKWISEFVKEIRS